MGKKQINNVMVISEPGLLLFTGSNWRSPICLFFTADTENKGDQNTKIFGPKFRTTSDGIHVPFT